MSQTLVWLPIVALGGVGVWLWRKRKPAKPRRLFIRTYAFPDSFKQRIKKHYPNLSADQLDEVVRGLRDYFEICLMARGKGIAMPSKVVDAAWHEFILYTRLYQNFCQQAFGQFLHHTPVESMASAGSARQGVQLAWRLACEQASIDHRHPVRLPRLFALDGLLLIPDGYRYSLDCRQKRRHEEDDEDIYSPISSYCVTDINGAADYGDTTSWVDGPRTSVMAHDGQAEASAPHSPDSHHHGAAHHAAGETGSHDSTSTDTGNSCGGSSCSSSGSD